MIPLPKSNIVAGSGLWVAAKATLLAASFIHYQSIQGDRFPGILRSRVRTKKETT